MGPRPMHIGCQALEAQRSYLDTLPVGHLVRAMIALRMGATARPRSEEHTSELQSLMRISYAVFCLKKKKIRSEYEYRMPTLRVKQRDTSTIKIDISRAQTRK